MAAYDPEDVVQEIRKRAAALGTKPIAMIIGGVVVLFFVATSWFTVQPEETGIIQRFDEQCQVSTPVAGNNGVGTRLLDLGYIRCKVFNLPQWHQVFANDL